MTEVKDGEVTEYSDNLITYDLLHDKLEERGKCRIISNYRNGIKYGIERIYYDDYYEEDYEHRDEYGVPDLVKVDKIMSTVNYINGKMEGIHNTYSLDGHLEQVLEYKNGILNGNCFYYSGATGILMMTVTFINGKKEGIEKHFNIPEYVLHSDYYGYDGDDDKYISMTSKYVNGVKQGPEIQYYYDNDNNQRKMSSKVDYINGKREGLYIEYYGNGKIKKICNNINGHWEGEIREFYEDGNLETLAYCRKGCYEGEYLNYYPTGEIKRRANYVHGVILGPEITYSTKGKIIEKKNWIINNDKSWPFPSVPEKSEYEKARDEAKKCLEKGLSIKETAKKTGISEKTLRNSYGDKYD